MHPGRCAHVAFANNGLVDEIGVSLAIGTPPRSYRVRLVFSSSAYPGEGARLVLYNRHHHLHSSSYETLIDGALGIDTIDFSGNRWRAKIAYARNEAPYTNDEQGIWLVSPHEFSVARDSWPHFLVTRHGLYTGIDADFALDERRCSMPLPYDPDEPEALGVLEAIRLDMDGIVLPDAYRVVVSPENITTLFPTDLFQRYFDGRNVFADDPATWPTLTLTVVGPPPCTLSWSGDTILPRSSISRGSSSHTDEPVLQTIMRSDIQADSEGELTVGVAMRGYNALKVHPHSADNRTIYLGGNVLWGSADVYIDQQSGTARLVSHSPGRHITLGDAFWLILLSVSYIRWKFAGSWLDTCDRQDHYMVILTRLSFLTSLSILSSHLSAYIFYLPFTPQVALSGTAIAVAGGVLADIALAFIITLYLRDLFRRALWDTVGLVVFTWKRIRGHGVTRNHSKPFVPERLPCAEGKWDPRRHYARSRQNKDFVWMPLHAFVLYTVLLDVAFSATAWITVAPFEDQLFADIILLLTFSVASYEVLYYTLLLATSMFYRKGTPLGVTRTSFLVLSASIALAVCAFTARYVVHRIIDDYSTMYEGSVLVFVTTFYMLVVLFVASRLAQQNRHAILVRPSNKGAKR